MRSAQLLYNIQSSTASSTLKQCKVVSRTKLLLRSPHLHSHAHADTCTPGRQHVFPCCALTTLTCLHDFTTGRPNLQQARVNKLGHVVRAKDFVSQPALVFLVLLDDHQSRRELNKTFRQRVDFPSAVLRLRFNLFFP